MNESTRKLRVYAIMMRFHELAIEEKRKYLERIMMPFLPEPMIISKLDYNMENCIIESYEIPVISNRPHKHKSKRPYHD